jgi:polysaccharide biosynthesis/export protein
MDSMHKFDAQTRDIMINKGLANSHHPLNRRLAGLTLFSLVAIAHPTIAAAQIPSFTPTAPSGGATASQSFAPNSYILGPGDRLRLDVFRVEQFSGETEVLIDGTVNLVQAGSVRVEGLTIEQAANAISNQYSRLLRRPIVTLSLISPRPVEIAIAGEVERPGSYTVPIQNSQFPTLTQVLQAAGGIRLSANLGQVQVRRSGTGGSQQTINVDLRQLIQTGDPQFDLVLRDGDNIFIPAADTINLAETNQIAAASFYANFNQPISVAVVGEVFRPGPYTLTGGTARTGEAGATGTNQSGGDLSTVTQAIQQAGGIKPLADISRIEIRRPTRNGSVQRIEVNLQELLASGDVQQDLILQDGDTVSIPLATDLTPEEAVQTASASFAPVTIRVNVVGEVQSPGLIEVPPNTPLNQALLAAGGFNNRARRGEVELVRLNPNGTVSQTEIPVDFAEGISEEVNPTLRNNDVVIVRRSGIAATSDTLDTILRPIGSFLNILSAPFRLFNLFGD